MIALKTKGEFTVITKVRIGRKLLSSILMAAILSIILVRFHGYAPFSIYFMYIAIGYLIIGLPCSVISDIIVLKVKGTILGMLVGLSLHLLSAGIVVYLFSLSEPEIKYASVLVYSVVIASAGLWLVDTIFKQIQFTSKTKQ
jgi:hypothetical protein